MSTEDPKIKILISYKNKHKIIKSDILTPIQTGRAIADEVFEDMIGDDTGDNISEKNPMYNELTAQYWTWKNYDKLGNPDYIGFMHYRRHFIFNDIFNDKGHPFQRDDKKTGNNLAFDCGSFLFENITEKYLYETGLYDKQITSTIKDVDVLILKPFDLQEIKQPSVRDDYNGIPGLKVKDYDLMLEVVCKLFPEYENEVSYLKTHTYKYIRNMFIMKKAIFEKYNHFLFTVLAEVEKSVNCKYYTTNGTRFIGYLGEILHSIFMFKLNTDNQTRIKELRGTFVKDTTPDQEEIKPFFKENYVPISMSCSNEYVPYLCVCLQSLKEHTSKDYNYDIIVFEETITEENKNIIKKHIECENISLRFACPSKCLENISLSWPKCYAKECFFRLTAPLMLKQYPKVVFTDIDLIFNDDVKKLHNVQLNGKPLAACIDYMFGAFLNNKDWDCIEYSKNILELEDPYKYINTGVVVLDLEVFRKNNLTNILLDLAHGSSYRILEQDILNKLFKENIKYLDYKWNIHVANGDYFNLLQLMPFSYKKSYDDASKNPSIIHYAGIWKPWFMTEGTFVQEWWTYARKTPYYEQILQRMLNKTSEHSCQGQAVQTILQPIYFYFTIRDEINYWRYRLMSHILRSKKSAHYKEKYHKLREAKTKQNKL